MAKLFERGSFNRVLDPVAGFYGIGGQLTYSSSTLNNASAMPSSRESGTVPGKRRSSSFSEFRRSLYDVTRLFW